ncbi:MAG: hypothetical protein HZC26_02925 [Candidatus Magasanikbacteria bacterium]|nr:hypothetical protein [Candidatus Magasanikbacteria bacterium]
MRRIIDNIEIKDPPIQELGKKKSCLRRSCSVGCGGVVIFIIASLIILKLSATPRQKELKSLPPHFPATVPVYDIGNSDRVAFTDGKEKGKWLEIAAYAPKLIIAPIVIIINEKLFPSTTADNENRFSRFVRLLKEPVVDHRDTIQIEWTELPAEPRFVYNYYKNELEKTGFLIDTSQNNEQVKQFSFQKDSVEGALFIEDTMKNKGTDYVSLTINFPSEL